MVQPLTPPVMVAGWGTPAAAVRQQVCLAAPRQSWSPQQQLADTGEEHDSDDHQTRDR